MYGIINKSIEELVIASFGAETWDQVLIKSGVSESFFISNEAYDDAITYQLAQGISDVTGLPLSKVLFVFGEWWITKTTKEKYGGMLQSSGQSLREFLIHLPDFHNRVMLLYPKLTPPEFKVSDITDNSIHVHYHSKRPGLKDFVHGLLSGLSTLYQTSSEIELIGAKDTGLDHDIFKVSW